MDVGEQNTQARLWVLEVLVMFQYAARHFQNLDPASALRELTTFLERPDSAALLPDLEPELRPQAQAMLQARLQDIAALQRQLPKRPID